MSVHATQYHVVAPGNYVGREQERGSTYSGSGMESTEALALMNHGKCVSSSICSTRTADMSTAPLSSGASSSNSSVFFLGVGAVCVHEENG